MLEQQDIVSISMLKRHMMNSAVVNSNLNHYAMISRQPLLVVPANLAAVEYRLADAILNLHAAT